MLTGRNKFGKIRLKMLEVYLGIEQYMQKKIKMGGYGGEKCVTGCLGGLGYHIEVQYWS